MIDSVKAEMSSANYKYKVNKEDLISIIEAYRQRTYIEVINTIQVEKLNGIQGILDGLQVTMEKGISPNSLEDRTI